MGRAAERSGFYRPELDALRFFAFLMVFWDHVPTRNRWLLQIHDAAGFGVGLFFCLSAYLIVTLLLREKERTGTVRIRAFAMRRILRIWPLYALTIGLGWLIGTVYPAVRLSHHALLSLVLMYANFWIVFAGWESLGAVPPLWSISVEEQFYLGIPFLVKLGGKRAVKLACLATFLVSYGTLFWLGVHHRSPVGAVWPNSAVQFQFFAAGGLIALALYERRLRWNALVRSVVMAGGLGLLYVAMLFGLHHMGGVDGYRLLLGYAAELIGLSAMLLSVLDLRRSPPGWMVYLGKISYGLYMFHHPLIWLAWGPLGVGQIQSAGLRFVTALGILGVTIGLAALSYRYFESPILKYKRRFETERTRPV